MSKSEKSKTAADNATATAVLVGLDFGTNTTVHAASHQAKPLNLQNDIVKSVVGFPKEGIIPGILPSDTDALFGTEAIDYRPANVEGTDLTRFQITIPLVGGYPNLRQFINELESSERLFIIDSVELTGARGGGAMLSLTIRISTYFRIPEQELGAITTAANSGRRR